MEIKGIIPAMVTPFDADEKINESALRKLVNHLIEGGVHGLFPTGSQGEFYALSNSEKQNIWEIVVDESQGRRYWSNHNPRCHALEQIGRASRC